MSGQRFEVRFAAPAFKEYENLDNSVAQIVDKKLEDLEKRADEIGIPLKGNLAGFREIKLRDAGIRIIYQITGEVINILKIVYIIAINRRAANRVFKAAAHRKKADRTMDETVIWERENRKRK